MMMTTTTIAARLLAAQSAIRGVPKDARNEFKGYDYASCEEMILAGRTALHGAGLVLRRGDNHLVDGMLVATMHLAVADDAGAVMTDEVSWPVEPGKGKPADAAYASALSSQLAYYLRDLLLIPRGIAGEEPMDARDDRAYTPPPPPPPPPKPESAPKPAAPAPRPVSIWAGDIAAAMNLDQLSAVGAAIRKSGLDKRARAELATAYKARRAQIEAQVQLGDAYEEDSI